MVKRNWFNGTRTCHAERWPSTSSLLLVRQEKSGFWLISATGKHHITSLAGSTGFSRVDFTAKFKVAGATFKFSCQCVHPWMMQTSVFGKVREWYLIIKSLHVQYIIIAIWFHSSNTLGRISSAGIFLKWKMREVQNYPWTRIAHSSHLIHRLY